VRTPADGEARGFVENPRMDPRVNFDRWSKACISVGVAPDEREYRRLRRSWGGMGRHYHTLTHLDACLAELDGARDLAVRPAEVELALWFHDAIYRSWRRDNEEQSAAWAMRAFRAAPTDTAERIRQMIMATRFHDEGLTGDAALVLDIDLSILGAPPAAYQRFERAIRREYWWVPRARYAASRSKILARFLERRAIYSHDTFYQRYEQTARANLRSALEQHGAVHHAQ
jgi:predicted metal-dependent HD superfamily phosphohydrolase